MLSEHSDKDAFHDETSYCFNGDLFRLKTGVKDWPLYRFEDNVVGRPQTIDGISCVSQKCIF
jgi:hypothetical protein